MNLYDIDIAIMNCIDEETGEIIDETMLDALEMERETKIENIACWIKNLNAEADAIKNEETNLKNRRKSAEKRADSLKRYLGGYLAGSKFQSPKVKVSFRRSEVVDIQDDALIPEQYLEIVTETKPKKTELKKALKAGEVFEGVRLVEKQNIQIV